MLSFCIAGLDRQSDHAKTRTEERSTADVQRQRGRDAEQAAGHHRRANAGDPAEGRGEAASGPSRPGGKDFGCVACSTGSALTMRESGSRCTVYDSICCIEHGQLQCRAELRREDSHIKVDMSDTSIELRTTPDLEVTETKTNVPSAVRRVDRAIEYRRPSEVSIIHAPSKLPGHLRACLGQLQTHPCQRCTYPDVV